MNELWYRWAKVWHFASLYGWLRTVNKVMGRTRRFCLPYVTLKSLVADTSFISCGQFAFNSPTFFLQQERGMIFLDAFDTNPEQAATLARYLSVSGRIVPGAAETGPAGRRYTEEITYTIHQ